MFIGCNLPTTKETLLGWQWHAAKDLGSVWNPESTRERKKNIKENDFLMFGSTVENIKENQI